MRKRPHGVESIRGLLFGVSRSLTRRQKQAVIWLVDVLVPPVALMLVAILAIPSSSGPAWTRDLVPVGALLAVTGAVSSLVLGLPLIKLKGIESTGLGVFFPHVLVLGAMMAATGAYLDAFELPVISTAAFVLIALFLSYGVRVAMLRALVWALRFRARQVRVLIYGAGATGLQLARALRTHDSIRVVGFVDDDASLHRERLMRLRIHPPGDIQKLVRRRGVERVLLAMPSAALPRQMRIGRGLREMGLDVQMLPSFAQMIGTEEIVDRLTPLPARAFLGRENLGAKLPEGGAAYQGRSVMVTGAGGTIGAELCRVLLDCQPERLVLFDVSEAALYAIDRQLRELAEGTRTRIVPILGSITDSRSVRRALQENAVETVLHAAAYKHVPLVECNPVAGLVNNVLGTRTLADHCVRHGVGTFLLISTDKAVRPVGIMGATKRLAEIVVQDMACRTSKTHFGIVRFGNVLGSSGSVIPLFKEQIHHGGPVTLTHREMTRYFMTIEEAARLVLLAGSFVDKAGPSAADVFVLDMGSPVRIHDLAVQMIEAAGYTLRDETNPSGDIEIRITGPRPGEKLHEELLIGAPGLQETPHPKILRASEAAPAGLAVAAVVHELGLLVAQGDAGGARALAMRVARGEGFPAPGNTALVAAAGGA